jgi:HTH-type transcriptional regulator/antitoxin HigA
MGIKSLETEFDYRRALAEIESLMTADPDTPEGERLEALVSLVEAYEDKHYSLVGHLTEGAKQARNGQFVHQGLDEMLAEFKSGC